MPVDQKPFELERLAVVTLQGGGVYGLTVAGQLDAVIERYGLKPMAIAGTSAGAIVAALYWSGMTPKSIRAAFESLARQNKITELLGPANADSYPFERLQKLKEEGAALMKKVEAGSDVSFFDRSVWSQGWTAVTKGIPFYVKHRAVLANLKHRGLFSGDELEKTIHGLMRSNKYLRQFDVDLKGIMGDDRELRFKHVQELQKRRKEADFPALFITATNLRTRRIEVFNSLDAKYAETPVARAARASASFPFAFRPIQVPTADTNDWYVGGGVISNFPVWIFGQEFRDALHKSPLYENAAQRPWMHVGLRRDSASPDHGVDLTDATEFGKTMFALLTGGARDTLEERIASEMTPARIVRQPEAETGGPSNVLDVSRIDAKKVREMFLKGARYARRELRPLTFHIPDHAKDEIEKELSGLVQRCNLALGLPDNGTCDFRSNLYLPLAGNLHRRFWFNMDPPSGHTFPFNTALTGYCFRHRVPMSCNLQRLRKAAEQDKLGEHTFGRDRETHLRVKENRTWLVSMPVFDPNEFVMPTLADRDSIPDGSPFHHVLPRVLEGVIYGVMNVDACLDYERFGIDADPAKNWTDSRLSAIIDLARVAATRIGRQLAVSFGGKERSHAKA